MSRSYVHVSIDGEPVEIKGAVFTASFWEGHSTWEIVDPMDGSHTTPAIRGTDLHLDALTSGWMLFSGKTRDGKTAKIDVRKARRK